MIASLHRSELTVAAGTFSLARARGNGGDGVTVNPSGQEAQPHLVAPAQAWLAVG